MHQLDYRNPEKTEPIPLSHYDLWDYVGGSIVAALFVVFCWAHWPAC